LDLGLLALEELDGKRHDGALLCALVAARELPHGLQRVIHALAAFGFGATVLQAPLLG
jgi:hypothetical protein